MPILILLISVFATAFISGVFGMAGGLILMGVLALILPVSAAMVVHGVIQFVSNGWRAVLLVKWVMWRTLAIYLAGSLSAGAVLLFLTLELDKAWLFIILGLTPGLIWVPRRYVHLDAERPVHAVLCGFVVTGLNVVSGVSGPLLGVFFTETRADRRAIVATKAATQVISHSIKVSYYLLPAITAGALPQTHWLLIAIPLSMLGTTLGARVLDLMSDIQFRNWTKWIVTGVGVIYVIRGVLTVSGS